MSVRVWGIGSISVSLAAAALAVGLGCDSVDKLPGALKAPKDPVKDPVAVKDPVKKPADPVAKPDPKGETKVAKTGGSDTKTGGADTKPEPKAEPKAEPTPPPAEPMITDAPPITVGKEQWAKTHAIAKVGDVMVYETAATGFGQTEQVEVTEVAADSVTALITTTLKIQGVPPTKRRQRYVVGDAPYSTNVVDDKVKFKDKEYDAKRTDTTVAGKVISKTWAVKELPLGGVVKTEDGEGKVISWLVDAGHGAAAPEGTAAKSMEIKAAKSTWVKPAEGTPEAKVGDWVETEMADGTKVRSQLLEVGENTSTSLTITTKKGGAPEAMKYKASYVGEPEKVKVGETEITAEKTETIMDGKPQMIMVSSKDVPLDGTVLMETDNAGQKFSKKLVSFKRK